jgi:excisionase family DNA binding protein
MQDKSLFEVAEVAETLSVSPTTVRRLITSGQLASITIGRRRFVPRDCIEYQGCFGRSSALVRRRRL